MRFAVALQVISRGLDMGDAKALQLMLEGTSGLGPIARGHAFGHTTAHEPVTRMGPPGHCEHHRRRRTATATATAKGTAHAKGTQPRKVYFMPMKLCRHMCACINWFCQPRMFEH